MVDSHVWLPWSSRALSFLRSATRFAEFCLFAVLILTDAGSFKLRSGYTR